MIVKYVRERGYKGEGKDPYLTLEKQYIVHGIYFHNRNREADIGICDDDNDSTFFELRYFDIIDDRIPNNWIFYASKIEDNMSDKVLSIYDISPQEFSGDFWDKYHDGDENAEAIFQQVAHELRVFHDWKLQPEFNLEMFDLNRVIFLLDNLQTILIENKGINFAQGKEIRHMLRILRHTENIDYVRCSCKKMFNDMKNSNDHITSNLELNDYLKEITNEIWNHLDCDRL